MYIIRCALSQMGTANGPYLEVSAGRLDSCACRASASTTDLSIVQLVATTYNRCHESTSELCDAWWKAVSSPQLFRVRRDTVTRFSPRSPLNEKSLQRLFQQHLPTLLGVQFLATEYPTGKTHGGRIDTLGIDDRATPVIIEYKRRTSPNLINQGLFYLDWLQDHRADYQMLVYDRLGPKAPDVINWSMPRLICVAPNFTRYDLPAVRQYKRSIELIRYQWFGHDLLMLETISPGLG